MTSFIALKPNPTINKNMCNYQINEVIYQKNEMIYQHSGFNMGYKIASDPIPEHHLYCEIHNFLCDMSSR